VHEAPVPVEIWGIGIATGQQGSGCPEAGSEYRSPRSIKINLKKTTTFIKRQERRRKRMANKNPRKKEKIITLLKKKLWTWPLDLCRFFSKIKIAHFKFQN
jgi:hypothetical protein